MLTPGDVAFGTPGDWLVLLVVLLLAIANVLLASSQWRGRAPQLAPDEPPSWFFLFGPAFWHGFRRSIPLYAGFCLSAGVPLAAAGALGSGQGGLTNGLLLFGVLSAALFLGLIFLVHVFAWPKWPIPPGHRHEPGAIVEWRDGIALRRRRERSS